MTAFFIPSYIGFYIILVKKLARDKTWAYVNHALLLRRLLPAEIHDIQMHFQISWAFESPSTPVD